MEDMHFTVLESRSALVRAIHILRHSPRETIDQVFRAIYGAEMKSSCAEMHAAVYAKMFDVLLNDFDERYKQQLSDLRKQTDCDGADPAAPRGSERTLEIHL